MYPSRPLSVVAIFLSVVGGVRVALAQCRPVPGLSDISADGKLDDEVRMALDCDGNGRRDLLDLIGRPGFLWLRLDGIAPRDRQGEDSAGDDGFRDAGYTDIDADCTDCIDTDSGRTQPAVMSGVNTGKVTIIYLPDSDGVIFPLPADQAELDEDDSLLYVGFDIFNGNPRTEGDPLFDSWDIDFVNMGDPNSICKDGVADFDNDGQPDFLGLPFDVDSDGDLQLQGRWDAQPTQPCEPRNPNADRMSEKYSIDILACQPPMEELDSNDPAHLDYVHGYVGNIFIGIPTNGTQVSLGALRQQLELPPGFQLSDFVETYPFDGQSVDPNVPNSIPGVADADRLRTDVEFIVRHIDTIAIQPGNCPQCTGDFQIDRYRFAKGAIVTFSDNNGDGSDEDFVTTSWFVELPQIDVKKEVRCVTPADPNAPNPWREHVEALPGSVVQFRINVENTGNVPLAVRLTDVLEPFGDASRTVDLDSLEATLYRPADNPNGVEINFDNAPTYGLNPLFFTPDQDNGFLPGVEAGAERYLGILQPVDVCADPNNPALGDRVELRFKVTVDLPDCRNPLEVDIRDRIAANGDPDVPASPTDPPFPPDGDEVSDEAGEVPLDPNNGVDTPREIMQGFDDNVVTVNVLCREVSFEKDVRLCPDCPADPNACGDFAGTLNLPPGPFPMCVQYRYRVTNTGEVAEEVTISDPDLCDDVNNTPGVSFVDCDVCPGPFVTTLDPNETATAYCMVRFEDQTALEAFLLRDDVGRECDDEPIEPNPDCYTNCGVVFADATDLGGICDTAEPIRLEDPAAICLCNCDIEVKKTVVCVDCDDPNQVLPGAIEVIAEPLVGGNGIADTTAQGDDEQVVPPGGAVDPGQVIIRPGPDGVLETSAEGDDLESGFLDAVPGSCVRYQVTVENVSDMGVPVCELRITDQLVSGGPEPGSCISVDLNSATFSIDATPCPTPPNFNVSGLPFVFDPNTCSSHGYLQPGEVVTIRFDAQLLPAADPACDPINFIEVAGRPFCNDDCTDSFSCEDQSQAIIDVQEVGLSCTKEWSAQWDSDADCEPGPATIDFTSSLDLREVVFPVLLTLRVTAQNEGEVPLEVTALDSALCDCVDATAGVSFVGDCVLCDPNQPPRLLEPQGEPGDSATWECTIRVETAAAMRALDACDGNADGRFGNTVTVLGTVPAPSGSDDPCPGAPVESDCSAEILVPPECEFSVFKEVKCADDPDEAYGPRAEAVPGARLTFRIRVQNDSTQVKLPRICLDDELSCIPWLVEGSCRMSLRGVDITDCFCADFENAVRTGSEVCFVFADCPQLVFAPWIGPGETLTITFDVEVPDDVPGAGPDCEPGPDPDCVNQVTVEGYTEVCVPPPLPDEPCAEAGPASAEINARVPAIECLKQVAADLDEDGTPDTPFVPDPNDPNGPTELNVPCDEYPFRLIYRFTAHNAGETGLVDVQVCDRELIADAQADGPGGIEIVSSDLITDPGDPDYGCAPLPDLPECSDTATAECVIRVPDQDAWEAFAGLDEDNNADCYSNSAQASADSDPNDICGQESVESEGCSTSVCVPPPCNISVDKKVRCITACPDGEPLGEFVDTLNVVPGSAVEFKIEITNLNGPRFSPEVCRLRIRDHLEAAGGNREDCVVVDPNSVSFVLNGTPCPVPPGFNLDGNSFEFDPNTCDSHGPMQPDETLTITFCGTIKPDADPNDCDLTNSITVEGAPDCPETGPNYCCDANDVVSVDVKRPDVECEKNWDAWWDSNADCVPGPEFVAGGFGGTPLDLSDKVFPVLLRLTITADNTGDVDLNVTAEDPNLIDCVQNTPNVHIVDVIVDGGDGVVQTTASGDDVQMFPPGPVTPGWAIILPGPNGQIDTTPVDDDHLATCELGDSKLVPVGQSRDWFCYVLVETAEAMRAMLDCNGGGGGWPGNNPDEALPISFDDRGGEDVYENTATVTGVVADPNDVCPGDPVQSTCSGGIVVPPVCEFEVTKQVVCIDCVTGDPIGDPNDAIEVAPGSCARFIIRIRNISDEVKLPRFRITDELSCPEWVDPNSCRADIAGDDVTDCVREKFEAGLADGQPRWYVFGDYDGYPPPPPLPACRPGAPWIAPSETLTITFDIHVPEDFDVVGRDPDCINQVTVEGYTEVCAPEPDDACAEMQDAAQVDVRVPEIACVKTIEADYGDDGQVDAGPDTLLILDPNAPNFGFPLRLIYHYNVQNPGEVPLNNVFLVDQRLCAAADHAGAALGPCDLDPLNCRADLGTLDPNSSVQLGCEVLFADETQLDLFLQYDDPQDHDPNCLTNPVDVAGEPDFSAVCPPQTAPDPELSVCQATVCRRPHEPCPPIPKAVFDVWNEDEIHLSGTWRCLASWDQQWLSRYTEGMDHVPNNFLIHLLQTNHGRAVIDGVAGVPECGPESIAAPLLGVVMHLVEIEGHRETTGEALVGVGHEAGVIIVAANGGMDAVPDLVEPRFVPRPHGPGSGGGGGKHPLGDFDQNPVVVASTAHKGSLIVFPKVEIKWDRNGNVIQDTFLGLTNDSNRNVRVYVYHVNGDPRRCNASDNVTLLTRNEPTYWSALTGGPEGVSPFTVLDPPRGAPDPDPYNEGGTVLRGYVLVWAVNEQDQEINFNDLAGTATVVNYRDGTAWEYRAWAFRALAGGRAQPLLPPFGRLDLDGQEYAFPPDLLLLDFFAPQAQLSSGPGRSTQVLDVDLTLWPAIQDITQKEGP